MHALDAVSAAQLSFEQVVELEHEGTIPLFKRYPVAFVRGQGSRLWDTAGKEYLDLLMGIAVCGLGHCHPTVVKAVQDQAAALMHISNLFYVPAQAELAAELARLSGGFLSYFANSGAEANECAIKLARKYGSRSNPKRFEIITATNSFHGRTMATISATGQDKVKRGFEPLLEGFPHVPFNDIDALERAITPRTTAVMLEVLQAESYNVVAAPGYLEEVRRLCDDRGLLLIFDEVQTGIGRSGHYFAWEHYNVRPDIFTLAKALGNGIPISTCLARPEVASAFDPGDHGGTFGGNPVACAAALAVLKTMEEEDILARVRATGQLFMNSLERIAEKYDLIREVRGIGLLIGVELSRPVAREMVSQALATSLVLNATSDTVIRLRPALNIDEIDAHEALGRFESLLRSAA